MISKSYQHDINIFGFRKSGEKKSGTGRTEQDPLPELSGEWRMTTLSNGKLVKCKMAKWQNYFTILPSYISHLHY